MNDRGRVSIWIIVVALILALVLLQLCGGRNLVSVVTETETALSTPVVGLRKKAAPHPNVTVVTLQGYEYLEEELTK